VEREFHPRFGDEPVDAHFDVGLRKVEGYVLLPVDGHKRGRRHLAGAAWIESRNSAVKTGRFKRVNGRG